MLHEDEILTDNTKIQYCSVCKECILQSDGTPFTNKYDKGFCSVYPFPKGKPSEVINNGACKFFRRKV